MRKSVFSLALVAITTVTLAVPVHADEVTLKLWSRADRSGPLRAANINDAARAVNDMLKAAGSETTIALELIENNAKGFDADALDIMKAFAVDEGPDIFVAAHEWLGAFAEEGYVYNLESFIEANPNFFDDIIPALWDSVSYKGARVGVPQDSEVRMFFLNNDILRAMGKDQAFIDALPGQVLAGEFTMYDMADLAAEAVSSGAAEFGLLHRPNVGPDFQMAMASFGLDLYNDETAQLQLSKKALSDFYNWLKYSVDKGAIPRDITTWAWDSVHEGFRGGKALSKFHGIWNVPAQMESFGVSTEEEYFNKVTWIHAPAGEKGGKPSNLSHPIVYAVSAKSEHPELAAWLVALASQHVPNTEHAITTGHTPINYGQAAMSRFVEDGWALRAGTPMLDYATFMPNHPEIGRYNAMIFQGIQAVETGEMDPEEAVEFVVEEMEVELAEYVDILD